MRYVERYLERLAERLGSPYLGTIVKGGGEGIRIMPPQATFGAVCEPEGAGCRAAQGRAPLPALLKQIAIPERFPRILGPFFQVCLRLPIAHSYFDGMLKKNGAYEKRFDRPLVEE